MIRTGNFAQLSTGVRLHYASAGDPAAPPLLLLHGFPEYWGAWEEVMPLLAADRYVIAPDLRGFNLSSQPLDVAAYRARELVADCVALIEHVGAGRMPVAAHDWGGAVAWQLAIAHPQRVDKLAILNSPHPISFGRALAHDPGQQAASAYMNWLRAPGSETVLAADDFAKLIEFFTLGGRIEAPWLTGDRLANYKAVWRRGLTGGVNYYRATPLLPPGGDRQAAAAPAPQLAPAKFRVRVPTLVIWGMNDPALLPVLLDGLEELVDDLEIERLPTATHWLIHEEPQFVAAQLRAYFAAR